MRKFIASVLFGAARRLDPGIGEVVNVHVDGLVTSQAQAAAEADPDRFVRHLRRAFERAQNVERY